MAIECPNCSHRLNLKSPKPGRFRPDCPRCRKPFLLIVPDRAGSAVQVRPLPVDTLMARPLSTGAVLADDAHPESDEVPLLPARSARHQETGSRPFSNATTPLPLGNDDPEPLPEPEYHPPPRTDVRGYQIERELGRGGMGAVYLARQVSLDRHVALKVMSKKWANDPVFVARFTREAYAAAQLSHPNIVQIHDIGEVDGDRFFSMEYVRGRSLADVVRADGKLDPETAVGYVLQAARGLKHAHDRGMIHRDVKPDNLLLDDQGLVKVADLGLVKTGNAERGRRTDDGASGSALPPDSRTQEADLTGFRIALGTPAYMSPEQCRDAAAVDHRADVYSLGCTLYVLVTGRPPFDGTTAVEVMSKHAYDPLVPPEKIVSRVPKELSAVIQRMMAKDPADRFQDMGEVVRTLEAWLGVRHAGTFSPQEEQIAKLEGYVARFNAAPWAVLRRRLVTGFFAVLALAAVLIAFFGGPVWAFGLVGLGVQSAAAYFLIDGVTRRGHLFTRFRAFLAGLTWGDWVIGAASFTLFCVLLAMLGALWLWAGFGLVGVGLAFALRYGLDKPAEAEQRPLLEGCERLLRRMRMRGLDEEQIRQFVAKFAGRDWEEFFEALFGYEAKLTARALLLRGGSAGPRERHAGWREPLIGLMDRVEKARRAARERKLLQAVERANLIAAGATPEAADDRARAAAAAMVEAAGQVQAEERRARAAGPGDTPPPVNVRRAVAAAEQNPFAFTPAPARSGDGFIGLFVGPHVRAVVAAILLAGFALWVHQNGLLPGAEVQTDAAAALEIRDFSALQKSATANLGKATHPLEVAGLPAAATGWVDGWNVGLAGLLLFGSLFFRGNVTGALALLGAGIAAVGHQHGIRTVEPFRAEHVALMLGGVLALVGFRCAR